MDLGKIDIGLGVLSSLVHTGYMDVYYIPKGFSACSGRKNTPLDTRNDFF
jgi:hypothetical protein